MIQRHVLAFVALASLPFGAIAASQQPPPEYASHVAAMRKADAIQDPLQRCLAYPDLPGNTWTPGVAQARCTMFLSPLPYTLDDIASLLEKDGGAATLDATFRQLLEAHYTVPAKREQITRLLNVFSDRDRAKAERTARRWTAVAPESEFAQAALGHALERLGWDARGTKYARDTPDANLEKMTAYFLKAAEAYTLALDKNPRLLPACLGLMSIGRQSSSEIQSLATQRCLQADPTSYFVLDEMMTAAEPRWGGSDAAMRSVAAYAMTRVEQNPVLNILQFHHAFYAIERMDDGDQQAIEVLEPAALQVPNAAFARLVGGAYLRKNETWKALAYLSQSLRFSPDQAQESRFRALALRELGETAWARADAERAVALAPANGRAQQQLGQILRELKQAEASLPHFRKAMDDAAIREDASNDYCGTLLELKRGNEAGACLDTMLAEFPENPEAWRQRLYLVGLYAPQSKQALENFLRLQDPRRWNYHAKAAERLRGIQQARFGEGASAPDFDTRVRLAKEQEGTFAGWAYYQRIRAAPRAGGMAEAISACQGNRTTAVVPQFTLVLDVLPDGTTRNIDVRPANAWTACMAKQAGKQIRLPAPPEVAEAPGYPLLFEVKLQP